MTAANDSLLAVIARIETLLPGQVERDASSGPLTTYRCGGRIAALVRLEGEDDLVALAGLVADSATADPTADGTRVPVLAIGRGSNLLIADAGFPGIAIVLGGDFERLDVDAGQARVEAGGGVPLPVLARQAAKAGVGGLEFYVGIPGSVGGAIRMNAGGHGAETNDVVVAARVLDLGSGAARTLDRGDLGFGYRRSALRPRDVVLSAVFSGSADDPAACETRIDEIVRWRRAHQPGGQNAGSVFTNPPADTAGRLIDACGLKGLRVGGAVVSEKHANFFAALPGARADDVAALVELVRTRVESATGIRLETELQLVGFDRPAEEAAI